ncbi:CysS/YqeB C-terminal domain-containing protein, partial [Jeotgalibaca porci]
LNMYSERETVSQGVLDQALEVLEQMMLVFGITLQAEGMLDDDIQTLIDERIQARKDKDFARSDEIRDYLKEQGIILDDTPQGTRWRRA